MLANDLAAAVLEAAENVLKEWGIQEPAVVVNFAFSQEGETFAVGTRAPKEHRALLAQSLEQSASELRET